MRKMIFGLIWMSMCIPATGQTFKAVDSKITDVTVFLSRAQITREVKTRVEPGTTNIVLSKLTAQFDPQSIQVSGKGNFLLLSIAYQNNYLNELNMPAPLKLFKDSLEWAQRKLIFEQSRKEILNKEEQLLVSNQKIGGEQQNLTVAELRSMADFYRTRLSEIVDERLKSDERIKKLNERIGRLQRQYTDQNELYSRNTGEIVISVSAEAATPVDLKVSYIVSGAGWQPLYDLRVLNTKSPVQLTYKANVYQSTGEDWKNVKLKLSTANPSLGGSKPELYSWYVDFAQPVALYGSSSKAKPRSVAAMPQKKEQYDLIEEESMSVAPAQELDQYVSTIQTAVNTEFNIALPYTVTSSSKPTLVDIQKHELKADYLYSVAPKVDPDAFLLAKVTGWEQFSLLPGEAHVFFEGTYVAQTHINPGSINDTLSVSLGRDRRIVVKREKVKDFTSRKVIGSNKRDSYAYEISVRNTRNEPVSLVVEDQVPVSKNSQIEVTVLDSGNAAYQQESGKLKWQWQLQPNETKKVTYKFEVKYPKDKIVDGL